MNTKPIKRDAALQPLSRQHHSGLLFCWKIRAGLIKLIEIERIKEYTDWYFKHHLLPHFELEEKHLFPILGNQNELTKRALSEHRKIKRLHQKKDDIIKNISLIEELLESHIRFEERVLFNKIQEIATDKELELIHSIHEEQEVVQEWEDQFWMVF
jgi:hemerythrin-like domain-containing protein